MQYLGIVERELRRASRLPSSYLLRGVYLALLVGIVYIVYWGEFEHGYPAGYRRLSEVGRELYAAFFLTEMALAILLCPILMCGAIADESSDRTIEVLLTTPMGRTGIVVAKFASRMAHAGMLFLASLPVLIACLALGGVAPQEMLVSGALLLGIAFWASSLTLLFSALVKRGYAAALLAYFAMTAWSIGEPLLWGACTSFRGTPGALMFVLSPPLYTILYVMGEADRNLGGLAYLPAELGLLAGTGALCLRLAGRFLGRGLIAAVPRGEASQATPTSRTRVLDGLRFLRLLLLSTVLLLVFLALVLSRDHWRAFASAPASFLVCLLINSWCLSRIVREVAFRGRSYRAVWNDPFLWKEVALGGSATGRIATAVIAAGVAFVAIVAMWDRGAVRNGDATLGILITSFGLAVLLVSVAGGASITAEREQGLLELLLATPASASRIFDGKVAGTLAHLAPLALFYVLYAAAGVAEGVVQHVDGLVLATAVAATSVLFHTTVGCACSLRVRKSTPAILLAMAVPVTLYILWPLGCFWVWWAVSGDRPRDASLFFLFQDNPFFFFAGTAISPEGWEARHYPIDFEWAAILHVGVFLGMTAAIRVWVGRNLRRWGAA